MSKPDLILIGAGGHARACIDVVEQEGVYNIAGLIGLSQEVGSKHFGYDVIATENKLNELARQYQFALIAVGQIQNAEHRTSLYQRILDAGFMLPTVIAPKAYVSPHSAIGIGTVIMHGAVVNAGVLIGDNCIINSNALIEHDTQVESHCHISTGVILNGNTSIGKGSFIGSGAVIKEGVSIGSNSLVGMGLIVRHNIEDNANFLGLTTR
jgi:sugar O-acyltransferase (sialic acid O-acetyltransferase NeuD family)